MCTHIYSRGSGYLSKAPFMFRLDFGCAPTSGCGGLLWCSHDAELEATLSRGLAWYIIWNMWSSRCKGLKEQTDLESQRRRRPVSTTSVCQHVCLVPFLPFLRCFLCVSSHIRWQKQADKFNAHTLNLEWRWMSAWTLKRTTPTEASKNWRGKTRDTFDRFLLLVSNIQLFQCLIRHALTHRSSTGSLCLVKNKLRLPNHSHLWGPSCLWLTANCNMAKSM